MYGLEEFELLNIPSNYELFILLVSIVPPTVTVYPIREIRAAGGSVEFLCTATGTPPPRIMWEKEAGTLPAQHSIQSGVLR